MLEEQRQHSLETPGSVFRGGDDSTAAAAGAAEGEPLVVSTGAADDTAAPLLPSSMVPHDAAYYLKCALGGVLSCGPTHTALTPLDVAKCNMQTDPGKYNSGLAGTARAVDVCVHTAELAGTEDTFCVLASCVCALSLSLYVRVRACPFFSILFLADSFSFRCYGGSLRELIVFAVLRGGGGVSVFVGQRGIIVDVPTLALS